MTATKLQQIDCEVTFTRDRPRGHELSWPKILNGGRYRPLLRVGGENFGVLFDSGPENPELEAPMVVTLTLICPEVSYDVLAPGISFTLREGAIDVGFGKVLRRHEQKTV